MNGSRPSGLTGGKSNGIVKLPDGKTKERVYNPDEYSNIEVGNASNKNRKEVGKFEGNGKRFVHIGKHKNSVGAKSDQEYQNKAVDFLSKPLGENAEDMLVTDKKGYTKRYRYDYSTNEFGVVNSRGNVSTYYKPDEGPIYWERQVQKYGIKR